MPEEYFDVAYINFDKAILHGRITTGRDEYGCRTEAHVEQVLTAEQKRAIEDLNFKHQIAMDKLLASFVDRASYASPGEAVSTSPSVGDTISQGSAGPA